MTDDYVVVFQFHSGSIKSNAVGASGAVAHMFQFHSGSIKRVCVSRGASFRWPSFNSIVVRLKVIGGYTMHKKRTRFNSIVVRLKAMIHWSIWIHEAVSIP